MNTIVNFPVNIIGAETYSKNCSFEDRWNLDVSEEQAEKIASGCKEGYINLRCIQGSFIGSPSESTWYGDNLGRIAEGLSVGKIQLQQTESSKPLAEGRKWTSIPTTEAKGWKEIFVAYVYLGEVPADRLTAQAAENPNRILYEAGITLLGQYIGLTKDLKLVVGEHVTEVVKYIQGDPVNEV